MNDKKIKINIAFDTGKVEEKDRISDQKIFSNYLGYAVNLGYREGLKSDQRRIWTKIDDRLAEEVEKKSEFFTVNSYEHLFLKTAFEKAVVPAGESKNFTLVENEVLNATDSESATK